MVRLVVQVEHKRGILVKQTIETVDIENDELESLLMNGQDYDWDVRVIGAQLIQKKLNCGKPVCPHSVLEEEEQGSVTF